MPPARGQRRQRVHAVAAQRTQVAIGEAGEGDLAPGEQGLGNVGEQHVAEVVAVEGPEDDGRQRRAGGDNASLR